MSSKKKTNHRPAQAESTGGRGRTATGNAPATAKAPRALPAAAVYLPVFILLWIFCTGIYGEVFSRTAEENFITTDATAMRFLTDQDYGWLYWLGRWPLLLLGNKLLGGLLLSAVLTLITILADRLLGLRGACRGCTVVLPGALLGWAVWQGVNLWHKHEPSVFVVLVLLTLLMLAVAVVIRRMAGGKPATGTPSRRFYLGWGLTLAVFAGLTISARTFRANDVLTARLQNLTLKAGWETMIEEAQAASRPSRTVAAYHAIALLQSGRLLEEMFNIPYDFPETNVSNVENANEFSLFITDCNFYAGLINAAYRGGMDHTVMNGPALYYLKRMALCAIVNGERQLARKYLDLIGKAPFEGSFVEKYAPLADDSALVAQDETLARVVALLPVEKKFEQQYLAPAFLGYNCGLVSGNNATLETALAARLYSKDLSTCPELIQNYASLHGGALPQCLQQVLVILAQKNPQVQKAFANVVQQQSGTYLSFLQATMPLTQERNRVMAGKSQEEQRRIRDEYNAKLREALRDDWLGSYFYYYFCENNDQNQVRPAHEAGSGIN